MKKFNSIITIFSILMAFAHFTMAEESVKTADKTHITLIAGTHHYSPQKTFPSLKLELERLGFQVTLINPEWNPEKDKRGLPGLEILKDTDLAVFFIRWLKLEGEQYNYVMNYVKAGKPVVGMRTSNHGFKYPKNHEKAHLNTDFGKDVLGTPYLIHLAGKTTLQIVENEKSHPILTGVSGTWESAGTLYLSKPEEGVKPLILGTGKPKKVGVRTNPYGTHDLKPVMTDNVAWTWKNKYGGKTFYTSLGHPSDFSNPLSMRVMINSIYWAAGLPVPAAETEINTFKSQKKSKRKDSSK